MVDVPLPPGMTEPEFRAILNDNTRFIPRLSFIDDQGQEQTLRKPYGEQVKILRGLNASRKNHVLKSRNIGCGTIVQARDFHYGWSATDPVATVVMGHEEGSTKRHLGRYVDYHDSLPPQLRHTVKTQNESTFQFADTRAGFWCFTAGGKGGGKSFTFQRAHFTELAYYDTDARDVYASVTAAMHESSPHFAITIESTSNGPGDFFHERTRDARRDPSWAFHFYPWYEHASFRIDPGRNFEQTLTAEERHLMLIRGLSLDQIAWRRQKIREGGLPEFHKYYPATVEEAFLSHGESFFPADWLMEVCGALPEWDKRPYRQFAKVDEHAKYVIGGDIGHGLKKDWSVLCVRDHAGNQVAVWSDNVSPPHVVGEKACELGLRWGKALLCLEAMGPGHTAIERARQLGYDNLWGERGKLGFETNRSSKDAAFAHARREMIDRTCMLQDRPTVEELVNIREDASGRIGAAKGHHDDHAMAWVLAAWAGRRVTHTMSPMETMKARFGLGLRRLRDTLPA